MRTTVHSSVNESPFERHYGRKPRTEIHNYSNIYPNKQNFVSAKSETLKVYIFSNWSGKNDQMVMKALKKLKEGVSGTFPYQVLEKKQNRNKLESMYDQKPQTAKAGTNHTITMSVKIK